METRGNLLFRSFGKNQSRTKYEHHLNFFQTACHALRCSDRFPISLGCGCDPYDFAPCDADPVLPHVPRQQDHSAVGCLRLLRLVGRSDARYLYAVPDNLQSADWASMRIWTMRAMLQLCGKEWQPHATKANKDQIPMISITNTALQQ